jgi:rhodanese-related sulfurtransferase
MNESTLFFLIDVRENFEWQKGSIPKAIHLSRGTLELKIEKLCRDPQADIVVYCGGGTRSAFAAESLGAMGYQNVKSLRGGFGGWVESDLPIEIPR